MTQLFCLQLEYTNYLSTNIDLALLSNNHRNVYFQHAYALELLKDHLKEGMKALDVGSGSGYLTVCFAHMVMPSLKAYLHIQLCCPIFTVQCN